MGRNLTIAFCGLVVVIGVWYLLVSTGGGANEAEMAKLRQRDAKRRAAAQEADRRSKTDLAFLAKQGRGQELPDYLVSEIDREANFWFVGKPNSQEEFTSMIDLALQLDKEEVEPEVEGPPKKPVKKAK